MAYPLRTRFAREIVAEFLPPTRTTRGGGKRSTKLAHTKVAIILDGAPSIPSKRALLKFLSRKGYWAFHPRYRGAWESDGVFLRRPLDEDVIDIIDELPKKCGARPDEIVLIASSFGGPAGILASRDPRVSKVVCISPVVDWRAPSKAEPLDRAANFFREGFGNGYRFGTSSNANSAASKTAAHRAWRKLASGKFYNPAAHASEIDGSKIFIFHARDDQSVRAREVIAFARATGAQLKLFPRGGHLSSSRGVPKYWKQVKKFL